MSDDLEDVKDDPLDWARVRRAVVRVEKSWPVVGPIVAFTTNWKAWVAAAGFFLWLRGDDILTAIVEALK